jgi:hypothetical protein
LEIIPSYKYLNYFIHIFPIRENEKAKFYVKTYTNYKYTGLRKKLTAEMPGEFQTSAIFSSSIAKRLILEIIYKHNLKLVKYKSLIELYNPLYKKKLLIFKNDQLLILIKRVN